MKAARKFMAFLIATTMMASNIAPAFASGLKYDSPQGEIVNNKLQVNPAKPDKGKSSKDLVTNPDQPAIYTLRTDYRAQKGEKYEIDYQPYIASVGGGASEDEQKKVNKEITLPDLAGYDKSQLDDTYKIDYDTVKNKADGNNETGNDEVGKRYSADQDFKYKAKSNEIKIKHLFQDMKDFTKYTNPGGADKPEKITSQTGNTGSTMEVSPLNENDRRGFVPEAKFITMRVPEDSTDFVLEYRYNRAHYDVDFDTMGGTALPTRTYYYDQEIPKIEKEHIPTKVGCDFLGWKPSHDLQTTDGKSYKAGEIINKADGKPALDLDVHLKMPALLLGKDEESRERLKFTAVWKDKEKADYAIQFWAEKADHADKASLLEKYEYMGTRVVKNVDTNKSPDLDTVSIDKIPFPDLDQARLQKIWAGEKFYGDKFLFLNKFFVYNKDLTHEQNKDSKTNVTKTISATGKTVYNIYYDRQVYDLYFTKSNVLLAKNTFYPSIYVPDGDGGAKLAGGPGDPYHYKARFNQLMLGWPNDAMQTKGFTPGMQSYGWGPNYGYPQWPLHLDTPPYRLNADEFLDMPNYENWGGYVHKIDKGDGSFIDVENDPRYKAEPYKALSFGIKQEGGSMPHHMDFWMDGFKKGETIIRYDLYRSKADTNSLTYGHKYSHVQGFTPYGSTIEEGSEEHGRVTEDDIDTLNDERGEITPYPDKDYTDTFGFNNALGKMVYRKAFFNAADEFGDPLDGEDAAFKENGYIRFKYKRNKYQLRFNYDPSKIKGDSEFNNTNSLDTFYEFPLKVLSSDLVPDGTPREEREYFKDNPKNLLDDPKSLQTLGLTDLVFTDPKDGKLKVKRPDGLSDQMVFKGWALDPAGTKLIWENPKETMPTHALNLYAKWGEPDYKWKVTFDPDGGKLKTIKEENLTQKRKTIQEGDIGQEEQNTYAKKGYLKEDPTTPDGKQIFTVIQRQKLVKPVSPTKKGYDFMGWEVIRYKKNDKGDYTDEIDTSYREKYGVPELYTFGNDVVSPIYLKAIWNPNQRVDVKVTHHLLDKDCKKDKTQKDPIDWLENKRTGYYTATVGDRQGETLILASDEDLKNTEDEEIKKLYEDYNNKFGFNNTYFQNQRIEPEKIKDPNTGEMISNPDYKGNEFHFFYRPFRQRQYYVNFLDERGKKEVEQFLKGLKLNPTDGLTGAKLLEANQANKKKFEDNKSKLNDIVKKYQIVGPETVTNGNRHYDARNYRRIPGWVLAENEKPQQQLFFDLNEETNEFLGINGTGSDQIFFYYKDIRVIEVPKKDDPVPDGYVRVTFKTDKGGSFGKDADGKDITELNYDVIKGLKSDLLPVPGDPTEESKKEKDKYYITPDTGKKFTGWDKKPLLNKNTIVDNNTKDFYVFTAFFDWSGLTAKGLVRTEAYKDKDKDPDGKWTNDFAPKIEDLKKQLVWKVKDTETKLPDDTEISFTDESGNPLTTNEDVYKLVNEKGKADSVELVRIVNIKAKVKFKDGEEEQILNIPVKVYKNVYEALTSTKKPKFLLDAEKLTAENGGLKDVTGDYVKVIVNPTGKPGEKDSKIYYVNKNAWVEIPEIKLTEEEKKDLGFTNWTADKKAQNEKNEENGVYDFSKRHKFTEDTEIKPGFANDVVKQKEGEDKPKVPNNFVKVIVKTTDKATTESTQTFWVNPTKEVTIGVTNPTGKTDQEIDIPKLGKKKVNYVFKEWQKVQTGEADDSLTKVDPTVKIDLAKNKYTDKVTVIEAAYYEKFAATPIVKPIKTEELHTPEGKEITDKDLIGKITPPANKEIESITVVGKPDPSKPGKQEAKVTIKYKDGSTQGSNDNPVIIPVEVHKNIIPELIPGKKPEGALDNYVKVIFKAGTGGSVSGDLVYYISPEVEVNMTSQAEAVTKTPSVGYTANGGTWSPEIKAEKITTEKTYEFNFVKSKDIVEKTDDPNQVIPEGYVKVTFKTEDEKKGKLEDDKLEKIYYVNPKAGITLKVLGKNETATDKQLAVPKTVPATNYAFLNWQENIDENTPITADKILVAQWQNAVQKINDGDTVEEQFIKVTFNEGKHGKLKLENLEQTSPVTYKVAKDLTFDQAVKAGLKVPEIAPAKYYKAKDENSGWDNELKLEGTNIEFTAQYEPKADVIPVDPEETDEEKIKDETPEGMVLVTFKVSDDSKMYIPNGDKYYVKKGKEVRILTPVILQKVSGAEFDGWKDVKLVREPIDPKTTDKDAPIYEWVKQSFDNNTVISDKNTHATEIIISKPLAGEKIVYIAKRDKNLVGKLEHIRKGVVLKTCINTKYRRRFQVFKLDEELQSGDIIRYWQEDPTDNSIRSIPKFDNIN